MTPQVKIATMKTAPAVAAIPAIAPDERPEDPLVWGSDIVVGVGEVVVVIGTDVVIYDERFILF